MWKGRRLRSLKLDSGEWTYTTYFALIDVVHDWGCLPSDFGLCNEEDNLSVMSAFTETVSRMRAWEQQEQEREIERNKHKGKKH